MITKTKNYGFDGTGVCCSAIEKVTNQNSEEYYYPHQPMDEMAGVDIISKSFDDNVSIVGIKEMWVCISVDKRKIKTKVIGYSVELLECIKYKKIFFDDSFAIIVMD